MRVHPLMRYQQRQGLTGPQREACRVLVEIGLASAVVRLVPAARPATPPGGASARSLSAPGSDPMQPIQGPEVSE